jgi:hypothetical protein
MTRKDYVAIAAVLAQAAKHTGADYVTVGIVAALTANVMARDNPRFDRARFLKACGVQS